MEKSKPEKNPWVKKRKKYLPKKKEISPFCQRKKKNLVESGKRSWFGQTPSTILTSPEDLEPAKILGASRLKIYVNASAGCEQYSLSESGGSDEEKKKNGIPTALNTGALSVEMSSIDSLLVESLAARFPPLTFLARVLPFPLVSAHCIASTS